MLNAIQVVTANTCTLWRASCNNPHVTANSVAGIGVLNIKGGHTAQARFFCVRNMASPLWAGRVGVPSGTPAPLTGTPILHGSALPDWRWGRRKTSRIKGAIAMTPRHIPAISSSLSPERIRANWHRRMAMACIKADSSYSVRLSRYRAHIEKARALEAIGGAA